MTSAPSVLVVGAGSIGSRHVRNLVAGGADVSVTDPDAARAAAAGARPIDGDEAWRRAWDGVVVASPTTEHVAHARAALAASDHVLVEKPLGTTVDDVRALLDDADPAAVAVAYNLRFHSPVQRIVDLVHGDALGAVRSGRLWFGSWLPDWRPSVDYRTTYSARRDLGGGVLLDAIHELDIAGWLFGELDVRGAVVGTFGPLEIDVEDTVVAVLTGAAGVPVTVSLDYLSRRYRRGIEVVGDDATARLDWARRVVEVEHADDVDAEPADDDVATSYERQAAAFLAWVGGGPALPVDGAAGLRSVALAEAIRRAAE